MTAGASRGAIESPKLNGADLVLRSRAWRHRPARAGSGRRRGRRDRVGPGTAPAGAPVDRRRRRRRHAGPRRHARPRQRAGAHRVGGLRDRDPRGGGRRRDDDLSTCRSTAIPPTTTRGGAARQARRRRRASARVDVGFWGGVVPGQRRRARARCVAAGVLGFKCFLVAVGRRRSSRTSARRDLRARAARARAARRGRCSCTPSSPRPIARPRPAASRAATRPTSRRARRAPRTRRSRCSSRLCRETGARVHIVHLSSAGALAAIARARGGGPAAHGRDLPALPATSPPRRSPTARRRSSARRRSASARTASGSGQALESGADRHGRLGSLALPAGAEAPRHRRLPRGLGRHRLAPARAAGGVDRRARRAGSRSRRPRAVDVRGAGAARRPPARKGAIAPGSDADLVVWTRGDASRSRPKRSSTATSSRPTPGERSRRRRRDDVPRAARRSTSGGRLRRRRRAERSCYDATFTELVDLAAERLGGAALAANDEFFAAEGEPAQGRRRRSSAKHEYTDRGKWMDGWETRRRREPGHDWCVVRLGLPGVIRGVVVDTAYFRGNFPEACSLEAARSTAAAPTAGAWVEILPKSALHGRLRKNLFPIASAGRASRTCASTSIPDGGVARLRVHGEVVARLGAPLAPARRGRSRRRSRTAGSSSRRATCSSARATT